MPTKQEFTTRLKEKYPQYNDVDNDKLFNRMMEKYPQYQGTITDIQQPPQRQQVVHLEDKNINVGIPEGTTYEQADKQVYNNFYKQDDDMQTVMGSWYTEKFEKAKKKGKITAGEQVSRQDITEMLPVLGTGEKMLKVQQANESIKRLMADEYDGKMSFMDKVKKLNNVAQNISTGGLTWFVRKQAEVEGVTKDMTQQEKDMVIAQEYITILAEGEARESTVPRRIVQGVAELPAFMGEFVMTGGIASVVKQGVSGTAKQAVKAVATSTAKQAVRKSLLKKAALKTGDWATTAAIRTTLMPQRIGAGFHERQLSGQIEFTEKGIDILNKSKEKPVTSLMKSVGDVYIENLTEEAGEVVFKPAAKLVGKVMPKKFGQGVVRLFKKMHPNKKVTELFTKAGYNGFIEEVGEERLGDLLRHVTGVQEFQGMGMDDMLVEAGVLAVPGVARVGTQQLAKRFTKNQKDWKKETIKELKEQGQEITPEIEESIDEVIQEETQKVQEIETTEALEPIKELPIEQQTEMLASAKTAIGENKTVDQFIEENNLQEHDKKSIDQFYKSVQLFTGEKLVEPVVEAIEKAEPTPEEAITARIGEIKIQIKEGAISTRGQIKATQTEFIKLLNKSDLLAKDKAKFIAKVKNTQTVQQLEKALPEIQERIKTLEIKEITRVTKAQIKKELKPKTIKAKLTGGKPVGKFNAQIQKILDKASQATKLTRAQAEEKIAANLAQVKDFPSAEVALENKILNMMAGIDEMTSDELQATLKEIKALKAEGRASKLLRSEQRKAQDRENIEAAIETISGGEGAITGTKGSVEDYEKATKVGRMFNIGAKITGWTDIANRLAYYDKSKPGESKLEKTIEVFSTELKRKEEKLKSYNQIRKMYMDAYGIEKEGAVARRVEADDSKVETLGTFKNGFGEQVTLEMSKAEIRKRWMELQDESLQEVFTTAEIKENGEPLGMGYTQEMIDAIDNAMTDQDKKFAKEQMKFYNDRYYNRINEIYEDHFGVSLPKTKNYSPIAVEAIERGEVTGVEELLQDVKGQTSMTKGSLKSRKKHFKPIQLQSDVSVLEKHVEQMEHFINYADKIRELTAIFRNPTVKKTIKGYYGDKMNKVISNFLMDMTNDGKENVRDYNTLNKFRVKFVRGVLALKPSITAKQIASFPAYMDAIPTKDFTVNTIDFFTNPIKYSKILLGSTYMKARGASINRDLAEAVKTDTYRNFRVRPSFMNMLAMNVQIGDKGAILMGGWSVYKHHLQKQLGKKEASATIKKLTQDQQLTEKEQKAHDKAIFEFSRVTNETQQSGDLSELSEAQRSGNVLNRLLTQFKSSQNQYFRKEFAAVRNAVAGKISKTKALKAIAIYHILLPSLFQWIANGFKWDEKEQMRAALLGSFNGIFVLGDLLDGALRLGLGLRDFGGGTMLDSAFKDSKRVMKFIGKLMTDKDEIDAEDVTSAMRSLASAQTGFTGLPLKQLMDMGYGGGKDLVEGEYTKGIKKVLGWSPYVVDQNTKKKKRRIRI